MTILFYLLAYAAIVAFVALVFLKVRCYLKDPVHVRWELYPVAHEGKKVAYGGSFMEETDWWTKARHIDHMGDIMALVKEVLFLHATFEHNLKLWFRTYPFHFGMYMLMGGIFIMLFAAILQICGVVEGGFVNFLSNVINAISLIGMLGIIGGGIGLIQRRLADPGLAKYTTPEHYFNLGAFIVYALVGLATWVTNPSFFELGRSFMVNLLTFNFAPLGSSAFTLHLLIGFALMVWIPMTHMGHLFMKYFTYHDIRWGDEPSGYNEETQKKVAAQLGRPVSWAAPHIGGDGKKTWVDVATSNPTDTKE